MHTFKKLSFSQRDKEIDDRIITSSRFRDH